MLLWKYYSCIVHCQLTLQLTIFLSAMMQVILFSHMPGSISWVIVPSVTCESLRDDIEALNNVK